jgi:DNA topoisomerase-3
VTIPEEIRGSAVVRPKKSKKAKRSPGRDLATATPGIEAALRAWRISEAKRRKVPAFRILTDKSLNAIAASLPGTESELLEVPGIGQKMVKEYGVQILRMVQSAT